MDRYAAPQITESLVAPAGSTAASRALLTAISADNGLPTLPTDGVSCSLWDQIELILKANGGTSWVARVYWFYDDAQLWTVDANIGAQTVSTLDAYGDSGSTVLVANTSGASRVYVRAVTFTGATASAWVSA